MQFVVIEWEVYSLTKDPLSLGIIGLMEVIPAVSLALFAGHVVDQKEKRDLLIKCILGFSVISLGLFLITWPRVWEGMSSNAILYSIYFMVFLGGIVRAFLGPTIFSLFSLIVPRKVLSKCGNLEQFCLAIGSGIGTCTCRPNHLLDRSALVLMFNFRVFSAGIVQFIAN